MGLSVTSVSNDQSLDQIFRSARTFNSWELGANFKPNAFRHGARWNPDEFAVEMHIVSLCPQIVTIAGFDFDFWTGESIHTESSRKYDAQSFTRLAERGGWDVAELWTDAERLFAVFGLVATTSAKAN